jgi:protein-S-isoprenylcysteine O-methyltransferase Ste14
LTEYLVIVFWVVVFGLQHSGLSALRIKSRIVNRWGASGYANIYKATSVIALVPPFLSMNSWDWFYFVLSPESVNRLYFMIGLALLAAGLAIATTASRVLSVSTVADMRTDRKAELVTRGIYGRVRHPLYLATILLFLSLIALYPFPRVAVFSVSFCVYILIGARLEERKLIIRYGQEYLDYRKRAGFMLPSVRKR